VGRFGKSKKRLVLSTLGFVGALVFAGCDWPMLGGNAALTGSSSDQAISSANVSTVQQLFTDAGQFGSPVVANGVVYAVGPNVYTGGPNSLEAFDANSGALLWTAAVGATTFGAPTLGAPAVANGVVYIVTDKLYAFDANGVTNCSGSPTVCQPLWTNGGTGTTSNVTTTISSVVANGMVYVADAVYDANGVTNCSGTPKVCQPLFAATGFGGQPNSSAVSNGVLYLTNTSGQLFAYSAGGTTNCSGTPTLCSPLWTASLGSATTSSQPAVSGGVVYAESINELLAFDANGVTNCSGTPTTCSPLWTAALDASSPPELAALPLAVANGIVYATANGVQAFDANGLTNCSGTPKTCTPLWSYNIGLLGPRLGDLVEAPSVANGLMFIGSLVAFDANGKTNCSGTPVVCNPLWTGPTGGRGTGLDGPAAIANGKVYVSDIPFVSAVGENFDTHLYAWVLPPPTTTVGIPSNNATVTGLQYLDSSASAGVTQVQYELTGGTLNHKVIAAGTPTTVGWLTRWDSTTVPNGVYTLQSVASYGGELSGTSVPITITVSN
jgi:hypothetical protein